MIYLISGINEIGTFFAPFVLEKLLPRWDLFTMGPDVVVSAKHTQWADSHKIVHAKKLQSTIFKVLFYAEQQQKKTEKSIRNWILERYYDY